MTGDLLLAGVASALMQSAKTKPATGTVTSPTESGPVTAQFSSEQIDQLAGALVQGVSNIQLPVTQVQFPSNLQATISDEQITRIASAISPASSSPVYDVLNRSVQVSFTGAQMNAINPVNSASFPQIVLLNQIQFIQDVRLVGIVLSASLLNTGTDPMGIYACRVTGNIINLDPPTDPTIRANDIYLSILTHNNSTVGTNAPASRTSSIGFSPKVSAVLMKAGSSIGIYGCSQNLASALLAGVLSVYYTTEE